MNPVFAFTDTFESIAKSAQFDSSQVGHHCLACLNLLCPNCPSGNVIKISVAIFKHLEEEGWTITPPNQ